MDLRTAALTHNFGNNLHIYNLPKNGKYKIPLARYFIQISLQNKMNPTKPANYLIIKLLYQETQRNEIKNKEKEILFLKR